MPNLHNSKMAAITIYFYLYLITWDVYEPHFGFYTYVFKGTEYTDNIHFSIEPFHHTLFA